MKKCLVERKDPFLALLDLRNTPLDKETTPANILMNRNLRDLLPHPRKFFEPKLYNKTKFKNFVETSQTYQKRYFDNKGVKPLPVLQNETIVKVQC